MTQNGMDLSNASIDQILLSLHTDPHSGLTNQEVELRHHQFGYNEILEKHSSLIKQFLLKFWGLSAWLLEGIIFLSFFTQKYLDAYVVIGLLIFNAIIGFIEEQKASNAVNILKKSLQITVKTIRIGTWIQINARELVPGDIIRLRMGDFVPADAKIVSGNIKADQSALTGESLLLDKKTGDLIFEGTIVKEGEAIAVIIQIGINTFYGKTTQLVQIAHPKLHLEEITSKVVKWLLLIVSILLGGGILVSWFKFHDILNFLPLVLVLLLSAIPVALPAMFTLSMALGSMELSKKGILVTRLSASEDAASMNLVCSDKTGTLTINQLTIVEMLPYLGFNEADLIKYGVLASQPANKDTIDEAFLKLLNQKHISIENDTQLEFIPFDPARRRTEAVIKDNNEEFRVAKGAVKTVLELCNIMLESNNTINNFIENSAFKGYRTLAVAKKSNNLQQSFQLVGIVALSDQIRPDSASSIQELRNLGISVKVLTGDAQAIAKEITKQAGLGGNIVKMSDFKAILQKEEGDFQKAIAEIDGIAEIFPQDKFAIVQGLQQKGYTLGMLGDGVNDAPALRQAEVGIAVKNASDVAKSAASVVLLNEGLSTIVTLVKEGRMIYQRITTWIINKIMRTLFYNGLILFSFFIFGAYTASAFEMILLLFLTDFVKIALATDNVRGSTKVASWHLTKDIGMAIILGMAILLQTLFAIFIGWQWFHLNSCSDCLETYTFGILLYFSLFSIFNAREHDFFWKIRPSRSLLFSIFLGLGIGTLLMFIGFPGLTPISWDKVLFLFLYSSLCFVFNDIIKVMGFKLWEIY